MAYVPSTLTIAAWTSPVTIQPTDLISGLGTAVNTIVTTSPTSIKNFLTTELAKIPTYLSTELIAINAEALVQTQAQVTLATAQVALATTQAGLATTNGQAQVTLAAAQVALATTQATNANNSAISAAASAALAATFDPTAYVPKIGGAFTGAVTGTSFNAITGLSSTAPAMNGTQAIGAGTTAARGDHVHPSDTLKLNTTGGTITGAIVYSGSELQNLAQSQATALCF